MRAPEIFHILVTDINHNVRNFLQRELEKEGYGVCNIKDGTLAFERIFSSPPLNLIIFDPEVFHSFDHTLPDQIVQHHQSLQIIIHTYADSIGTRRPGKNIYLVEKNGQSIKTLTSIIGSCFDHFLAGAFLAGQNNRR